MKQVKFLQSLKEDGLLFRDGDDIIKVIFYLMNKYITKYYNIISFLLPYY